MNRNISPVARIWQLIRAERSTFSSIYFYAILAGLIQLSLPVGIQSIINFVLGGTFSTSLVILIIAVVAGVLVTGLMYINQMKLIEKIQQTLFVRYAQGIGTNLYPGCRFLGRGAGSKCGLQGEHAEQEHLHQCRCLAQ